MTDFTINQAIGNNDPVQPTGPNLEKGFSPLTSVSGTQYVLLSRVL